MRQTRKIPIALTDHAREVALTGMHATGCVSLAEYLEFLILSQVYNRRKVIELMEERPSKGRPRSEK